MTGYEDRRYGAVGIVEAVETLTSIADLQLDGPIAVAEKHEVQLQELPIIYNTVHWLHRKNAERVMHVVRDTYKTILNYLRHFYKKEYGKLAKHESVEGIKTIMVLVGEAAKKVDKYSRLFAGASIPSIKHSKEFHDLLSFYQRKIAPIGVQESLSKWIHGLPIQSVIDISKGTLSETTKVTEHLFVDLDSVKKDSEYDLFFIRKQDGSRFFNPRLLRNMKLVSNFEQYIGEEEQVDQLKELKVWKDHLCQHVARNLIRQNWHYIDQFIKVCNKHPSNDVGLDLYRALVALMLSANHAPSMKQLSKGASDYFRDFQFFLRDLVSKADYHRLITYPSQDVDSIQFKTMHLVQELLRHLYTDFHMSFDVSALINQLVAQGRQQLVKDEPLVDSGKMPLSTKMAVDYDSIMVAMQRFGHAPLLHVLEDIQDTSIRGFDALLLQNLPSCIFDLFPKQNRIPVLRLPSPTTQEYINKAHISEEFKVFVRSLAHDPRHKKLLVINLQDRTGWREFARSQALEDLQKKEEFSKGLSVVSMTKDSDFYHQIGPYADLNQATMFIDQLLEHVQSETSGYYYPAKVKEALFGGFAQALGATLHELFFSKKNVLSRHSRQDFIELFYLFMQLKIIELVQPTAIGFSCKDAIDKSMPAGALLFLVLKLINARPISAEEEEYLKLLLYSPSILLRGRNLFQDCFTRLNGVIKVLESVQEELGEIAFHKGIVDHLRPLFNKEIFSSVVEIPQPLL